MTLSVTWRVSQRDRGLRGGRRALSANCKGAGQVLPPESTPPGPPGQDQVRQERHTQGLSLGAAQAPVEPTGQNMYIVCMLLSCALSWIKQCPPDARPSGTSESPYLDTGTLQV